MKLLDMFTGSVAKVARELGFEVTTLDIDPRCKPDVCANVNLLDYKGDPVKTRSLLTSLT